MLFKNKKVVTCMFRIGFRSGSSQIFRRERVAVFIVDETVIKIGNQYFGLGFGIE
jgi:hypothetical protein